MSESNMRCDNFQVSIQRGTRHCRFSAGALWLRQTATRCMWKLAIWISCTSTQGTLRYLPLPRRNSDSPALGYRLSLFGPLRVAHCANWWMHHGEPGVANSWTYKDRSIWACLTPKNLRKCCLSVGIGVSPTERFIVISQRSFLFGQVTWLHISLHFHYHLVCDRVPVLWIV